MIKRFVAGLAVLWLWMLVPDEAAAAVNLALGLKAGASMARIRETFEEESIYGVEYSDRLTRPIFGAFVSLGLGKSFAIQPEIYLLTQGGDWPDPLIMLPEKLRLRYIHVPILAKISLFSKGRFVPFLLVGPSLDFLLSVQDWYYDDIVNNEWFLSTYPATYKSPIWSLVMGVGAEQKLGSFKIILDIRSNLGISHIGIDAPHEWGRTRATMVMLGVGF